MARKAARKAGSTSKPSGAAKPRPLRTLSPAYRARLQAYAKKHGVSVTQARTAARGHGKDVAAGKSESQVRRERAAEKLRRVAREFAAKQAGRWPGRDQTAAIEKALREQVKVNGMSYLGRLMKLVASLEARLARQKPDERGHRSLGIGMDGMDDMAERWSLPVETFGYH